MGCQSGDDVDHNIAISVPLAAALVIFFVGARVGYLSENGNPQLSECQLFSTSFQQILPYNPLCGDSDRIPTTMRYGTSDGRGKKLCVTEKGEKSEWCKGGILPQGNLAFGFVQSIRSGQVAGHTNWRSSSTVLF